MQNSVFYNKITGGQPSPLHQYKLATAHYSTLTWSSRKGSHFTLDDNHDNMAPVDWCRFDLLRSVKQEYRLDWSYIDLECSSNTSAKWPDIWSFSEYVLAGV